MSIQRLNPLTLLEPQMDPFTQNPMSEFEFRQCLNRPCDESEFILLSCRYLQQIRPTSRLHLHCIQEDYLNGKNKEAIDAIRKLAQHCKTLDSRSQAYDVIINKTLNEVEIYKNHQKRFFENRLAQFYEGSAASAAIHSVNAVLSKYFKKNIHTVDNLFTAIVDLENLYGSCQLHVATSQPDDNYLNSTTSQADHELILFDSKLFYIDRINKSIDCICFSLNTDQTKQLSEIFSPDSTANFSYIKRIVKNITEVTLPNIITRGEEIKESSEIYKKKDRAHKEDIVDYPIYSANLGLMTSLAPNYLDEINATDEVNFIHVRANTNRATDRGFISLSVSEAATISSHVDDGYSKTHINHPFVGSVSGHCYGMIAILEDFCEGNKLSPSLSRDVNETLRAFILTFISYGFHSYGEIVDVLSSPRISEIFLKYNVRLDLNLPKNILEAAFRHATEYAKSLALKDSLHYEIFKKNIETSKWENACKILVSCSPKKVFHYLKEASLSNEQLNKLYKCSKDNDYPMISDCLLIKFTDKLQLDSYTRDITTNVINEIYKHGLYRFSQLRDDITKNPSLVLCKIRGIGILGALNCARYGDFIQAILNAKKNDEIMSLLKRIDPFYRGRCSHPINFLADKNIRKAIIENTNIDSHLVDLQIYENSLETYKSLVTIIHSSSHPLTLVCAIVELKKASLLTDEILSKISAHSEHSITFAYMVSNFNKFNVTDDQKNILFSIIDKNPKYVQIVADVMKFDNFNYKLLSGEYIEVEQISSYYIYSELHEMTKANLIDKYKSIFLKYPDADLFQKIDKLNLDLKLISAMVDYIANPEIEASKSCFIQTISQVSHSDQVRFFSVLPQLNPSMLAMLIEDDSVAAGVLPDCVTTQDQLSNLLNSLNIYEDKDQIHALNILQKKLFGLLSCGKDIDSFLNNLLPAAQDHFYNIFLRSILDGSNTNDEISNKLATYHDHPTVYSRLSAELLKQRSLNNNITSTPMTALKLLFFSTDTPTKSTFTASNQKSKNSPG